MAMVGICFVICGVKTSYHSGTPEFTTVLPHPPPPLPSPPRVLDLHVLVGLVLFMSLRFWFRVVMYATIPRKNYIRFGAGT